MTNKPPKRLDMPEISAAACNNFANQPERAIKIISKLPIAKPIIEICHACGKEYDKQLADNIIKQLSNFDPNEYVNSCLNCIREQSKKMKASYYPGLKEAKETLEDLSITYQKAHNHYKSLAAKYKSYDYLDNMISHHLIEQLKPAKTAPKKSDKTSMSAKKALALKVLSKLTDEQREEIIANIKLQG